MKKILALLFSSLGLTAFAANPVALSSTNGLHYGHRSMGAYTNDSISGLANSRLAIKNGAIFLPAATVGGVGNNFGGQLQWGDAGVPTWPWNEGSGSTGMGLIGMFHNWGGGASNTSPTLLVGCRNIRLENSWYHPQYDSYISIGNEDQSGIIYINYVMSTKWDGTGFRGNSYPVAFQCIDYSAGFRKYCEPGLMARVPTAGTPGFDSAGQYKGDLGVFSSIPYPNSSGDYLTNATPGTEIAWFRAAGGPSGEVGVESLGFLSAATKLNVGNTLLTQYKVTSGLEISSGLQPGLCVGANNNSTSRTDGTDKTFYASLAPINSANPSHCIFTATTSGGYPAIWFGGGTSTLAPCAEVDFYAGTGPITTTGSGNLQLSIVDGAVQIWTRFRLAGTVTAAGTTTTQTINKPCGTVNFPAAAATVTVNNSYVTVDSIITCVVMVNDTTALLKNVVPSAGSFVIRLNANTTAETKVGFVVHNPN